MVISGRSVSRLVSSTCLGRSGKKGRNSDAAAMLNMLPKLALVAMNTYFSVLAKVRRPSATPWRRTWRSVEQHQVRRLGHVGRAVDGDADVGRGSAGASLMPSPMIADAMSGLLAGPRTIRSFCWDRLRRNRSVLLGQTHSASSFRCSSSAPVSKALELSPTISPNAPSHSGCRR